MPASWTQQETSVLQLKYRGICRDYAYLQLGQGEPPAGADTTVVFDGRATDDRSQLVDRTRRDGRGLGDARIATAKLAAGLGRESQYGRLMIGERKTSEIVIG